VPARLDETVPACREALQELIRERVPLQWAAATGNQGVALMALAERRGGAEMAKLAVQQIDATFTASRDSGDAPPARLPKGPPSAEGLFQKFTQNPRPHPEEAPKAPSRRASKGKPLVPLRAHRSAVADAMGKRALERRLASRGASFETRAQKVADFLDKINTSQQQLRLKPSCVARRKGTPVRAGGAANTHAIDAQRAPVHSSNCGALLRLCEAICDLCRF
jgi:hypothetical protein